MPLEAIPQTPSSTRSTSRTSIDSSSGFQCFRSFLGHLLSPTSSLPPPHPPTSTQQRTTPPPPAPPTTVYVVSEKFYWVDRSADPSAATRVIAVFTSRDAAMDYAHTFACHASKLKGLHAQARRDGWDEGELFELHDDEYAHLEGEDFTVPDDASIDSSRAGYDAISDDPNFGVQLKHSVYWEHWTDITVEALPLWTAAVVPARLPRSEWLTSSHLTLPEPLKYGED